MNATKKELLGVFSTVSLLVLVYVISILLMTGCSDKQYIVKYKYIKTEYPELKVFKEPVGVNLTAYNNNTSVCIKEWKCCLPKQEFLILVNYIDSLKHTILLYKQEVTKYNQLFAKDVNGTK